MENSFRLRFGLAVFSVTLSVSQALAGQNPGRTVRDIVGCYALFTGGNAVDSTYYNSSPRVRLDSTAGGRRRDEERRLRSRIMWRLDAQGRPLDGRRGPMPFTWWVDSLSDSLHLSFVDGLHGTVLVLASGAVADTLYGRIEEHWDFGPPFVTSQQSALSVQVPCRSS